MSCPSPTDERRPKFITNWHCLNDVPQCPENFTEIGLEVDPNKGPGYCTGDFINKVNRGRRICVKSSGYDVSKSTLMGCCSGVRPAINCSPRYCRNSPDCKEFLRRNCSAYDILDSNSPNYQACNKWCVDNPAECNSVKSIGCNNPQYLSSYPQCKSFAIENGGMDAAYEEFCRLHPADPFCSCKNTNLYTGDDPTLKLVLNNPVCFDNTCKTNGYKTTGQRMQVCPSQINVCNNILNTSDINESNIGDIIQSCSSTQQSSQTSTNNTSNTEYTNTSESPSTSNTYGFLYEMFDIKKDYNLLFLLIFIAAIVIFYPYTTNYTTDSHIPVNNIVSKSLNP